MYKAVDSLQSNSLHDIFMGNNLRVNIKRYLNDTIFKSVWKYSLKIVINTLIHNFLIFLKRILSGI